MLACRTAVESASISTFFSAQSVASPVPMAYAERPDIQYGTDSSASTLRIAASTSLPTAPWTHASRPASVAFLSRVSASVYQAGGSDPIQRVCILEAW